MSKLFLDKVAGGVLEGESFLVTLSGGADSVALLGALTQLGHVCRAVHCNFGLRGAESERDERHARDVARRLGVDIDVIACDVEAYRQAHPGTSVEMACRDLRYEAFERLRVEHGLDSIAVGHHLEDNIETMLINMLRGSGIKGLAAMRSRRGHYVRPMLGCTRDEILAYLDSRSLRYVTDSSNLTSDYRRNALRNEIIPLMQRYFPTAMPGMAHTLDALASQRNLLEDRVAGLKSEYVAENGTIDVAKISAYENYPADVLFELLNSPDYRGYNRAMVHDILEHVVKARLGGRFAGTDGSGYLLDRNGLVPVEECRRDDEEIVMPVDDLSKISEFFDAEIIEPGDFRPTRDPEYAYYDLDVLKASFRTLVLRHPRPGDRLQPWGMKGSRLLSDIFTDLHYSLTDRNAAWVLAAIDADGHETLLWLVGIRASRHAAVTPATGRILRLHRDMRLS